MSVATHNRPPHASHLDLRGRWKLIAGEITGTAVIMTLYFLLRGIRPDAPEPSVSRSLAVINFEQRLGLFKEVRIQELFLDYGWLMSVANVIYAWGHYPVLLAIALWLVFKDPVKFRFVRNVMLVSATIGILTYWLLPAAPPRLMEIHGYDFGFIDTVHGGNVHYFQPGPFVNDYAALPSFHFGWIALASAAIWVNTSSRSLRIAAVALSVLMTWAIVASANHFFFDMALGGAVVFVSWRIARRFEPRPAASIGTQPAEFRTDLPRAA